jgi:predicted nucleic acid-binding protein
VSDLSRGLADTSLFIGRETGRSITEDAIPEEIVTSVVTYAELQAGVLAATDVETRARRLTTLELLAEIEVLPVDVEASRVWAALRAHLAAVKRKLNVNDLWIAAIAAANDLPVLTQDADFSPVEGVAGVTVIRV